MRTGYVWHADYIHFKVRGIPRWMFGVMDAVIKLIIAHDTAEDKFKYNATELFKDAIKAAGKHPDVLVTDGLCRIQDRIQKGGVHTPIYAQNYPCGTYWHTRQAPGKQRLRALQQRDT